MSEAWKNLERKTALLLGGCRVYRGDDFSRSDTDVRLDDFPEFAIDCKYKKAGFAHHSIIKEIREKYCKEEEMPVLVTKSGKQHGEYVTVELETFAGIIALIRELRRDLNESGLNERDYEDQF